MTKIFAVDVKLWATAYIKAETQDEAYRLFQGLTGGELTIKTVGEGNDVEVSDLRFEDPELPNLSLSPAVTIDTSGIAQDDLQEPWL